MSFGLIDRILNRPKPLRDQPLRKGVLNPLAKQDLINSAAQADADRANQPPSEPVEPTAPDPVVVPTAPAQDPTPVPPPEPVPGALSLDAILENVDPVKRPKVTHMLKNYVDNTSKAAIATSTLENYRKGIAKFGRMDEQQVKDDKFKKGMKGIFRSGDQ